MKLALKHGFTAVECKLIHAVPVGGAVAMMMGNVVRSAVKPLAAYVDATINMSCEGLGHYYDEKMKTRPARQSNSYSIFKTLAKQREMVSPEIAYRPYSGGVRSQFLSTLGNEKN